MFLIIKKKKEGEEEEKERKTHSSFPLESSEAPLWPLPLCQMLIPFISRSENLIVGQQC